MPREKRKVSKYKIAGNKALTVAQFLFDQLLEFGELLPKIETPYAHSRRLNGRPLYYPHRINQQIKRMKNRGWIIEAEKQGKKFLKLTKKGKLNALYGRLGKISNQPKQPWDGKWRMALFDIPEKGRRERSSIRSILKLTGFYQLQKSVYIYPYELPGEMIVYLKTSGLLPFIRLARIDKIDDADNLKKHFKL